MGQGSQKGLVFFVIFFWRGGREIGGLLLQIFRMNLNFPGFAE